ncbi:MAG: tetratricopeptide repeat protein [Pseudomonadota bacterium]
MKPLFTISFLFLSMLWIVTVSANSDAQADFEQGAYTQAKEKLEVNLKRSPEDVDALLLLGKTNYRLNELDDAVDNFQDAIAIDSKIPEAHYWIGVANGRLAGNASIFTAGGYAKKSLKAFETAIELEPTHIEAHRGLMEYYLNAPRIFGGSAEKAMEAANRLKKLDPLEGKLAIASVYDDDDKDELAIEAYKKIIREHPSDPRAYMSLGFRTQAQGEYEEAHSYFSQASQTPTTQVTQTSRSMALYQIGKTAMLSKTNIQQGIDAYIEYLELPLYGDNPVKAWAHYRLGNLYEMSGNAEKAKEHLTLARDTTDRDLLRIL